MKKLSLLLVVALTTTLFLDSCSVQKRYHRTGFNVNWNHTSIGIKKDRHKIVTEDAVEEEVAEIEKATPSTVEVVSNDVKVQEVVTPQVVNAYEALETENAVASNNESVVLSNVTTTSSKFSNDNLRTETKANHKLKNEKTFVKKMKNSSEGEGGKSWLVALLLCIFLGALGIHRFYLGYTGLGILYLLTGGICGIGVLVDFIMLLTGSLKPKNDDYNDK